jgi:hypothetical protein
MFTIPLAAKLGLAAAGGLLLLGAAAPAVSAVAPVAAQAATAATTPTSPSNTGERKADRRQIARDYLQASATVLGMSAADLKAAFKGGKSLGDLATAKGMTKDVFADQVGKAIKPLLDADVDQHLITRAQADKFEKRLAAGRVPLWDRHRAKPAA